MKCYHCGFEMPDRAKFCEQCGTPVGSEKTILIDDDTLRRRSRHSQEHHSKKSAHHRGGFESGRGDRYDLNVFRDDVTRRRIAFTQDELFSQSELAQAHEAPAEQAVRYADEEIRQVNPPRSGYTDEEPLQQLTQQRPRYAQDPPRQQGTSARQEHKSSKKPLIIALIAALLVLLIGGGVFFFFFRNKNGDELEQAKEEFLPPAKAVSINTALNDPSDDKISFTFDERSRILTCSYSANDLTYDLQYTYQDDARKLSIDAKYKDNKVESKEISYDSVKSAGTFEVIDDYYVRLDAQCLGGGAQGSGDIPVEIKSEDATITPSNVNNESIAAFLESFAVNYYDYSGAKEYDCKHAVEGNSNIFSSVCQQLSCVNWSNYSGSGRVYNSDEAAATCPWGEIQTGVVINEREEARWICKNIFHITDEEIDSLVTVANDNQSIWEAQIDGVSYYCAAGGKGSPYIELEITDAQTDGRFWYVTYHQKDSSDTALYFTILEQQEIDGKLYWTMYYHTANVPETIVPYEPN